MQKPESVLEIETRDIFRDLGDTNRSKNTDQKTRSCANLQKEKQPTKQTNKQTNKNQENFSSSPSSQYSGCSL